ncbi:MAG: aminopeptidase [Gaiellaceae bacterium]|jgi:aminopeptidase|nr:aminopeptidase [Gaiellaceae bacterium]
MSDAREEQLADVLVGYSTHVEPGDLVLIDGPSFATPMLRTLYRRVLAAGGNPYVRISLDGPDETLLREGNDAQLEWVNPLRKDELENADVRIALYATWNTRALSGVDPSRQALVSRARQVLGDRTLERAANGELRWVLSAYPCQAGAQDAEMSLAEYTDFVYNACRLDASDPVAEWRKFAERLKRVAAWLAGKRELRVVAEGTDLLVGVEGRTWAESSGQENFPDGEVFTGPLEDVTEGTVRFTYPAVFQEREVHDVRLRFEGGRVVDAQAARGQDFLEQMLEVDAGARILGEFAFGLNDAISIFTKSLLFDEKIGGTVHMALGTAYPETGGLNRSGLHWDMICDLRRGGEVYADGELAYRDGRFLDEALN